MNKACNDSSSSNNRKKFKKREREKAISEFLPTTSAVFFCFMQALLTIFYRVMSIMSPILFYTGSLLKYNI